MLAWQQQSYMFEMMERQTTTAERRSEVSVFVFQCHSGLYLRKVICVHTAGIDAKF